MNATTETTTPEATRPETVFGRVLVGIDGSPESHEAARQAARLLEPEGELTLLSAYDVAPAIIGGTGPSVPVYFDEEGLRRGAEATVRGARAELELTATGKVARGRAWDVLLREAERDDDTLIALGSHGLGRALGIVMGSTVTEVVHKARCSVLVARTAGPDFPRRIVVGVDGSPESAAAYETARRLAARFTADLWPVVAHGGKGADDTLARKIVGERREDLPDDPVAALVAAAADADLVVVGSRGLHGLGSLGAVSERVAHQARASVLIVRGDDPGR
jgi:nucleotide-binding universal stress UspA family protein